MSKTIISVSRRTDIPAFYSEWFMSRIREGHCTVVNPYNAAQVSRVSLAPEDVEIFVFWTRNAAPLMKHLEELDKRGYKYYFLYTILGYPKEIDPFCPELSEATETFINLSRIVGKEKMVWRYDPVLFSNRTTLKWHKEQFFRISDRLSGAFEKCVFSIIDPYRKTTSRISKETSDTFELSEDAFEPAAYLPLVSFMAETAERAGFELSSCAEEMDLSEYDVSHGNCIDSDLISRITGHPHSKKKDANQRKSCNCVVSKDIGVNNTCIYGCKYCYATNSLEKARENRKKHDPSSESLI